MEIIMGVTVFTAVIMLLVFILIKVSKYFSHGESAVIDVNDSLKKINVKTGETLLNSLSNHKIFIPSACGGTGSCGMCKCKVNEGGGELLPTEFGHIKKSERRINIRLACQVKVRNDIKIEVPKEILDAKKWECEVVSNRNVATFIKELTLKLPQNEQLDFKAGGYVQIDIPKYDIVFKNFDIDKKYLKEWEKFNLFEYAINNDDTTYRAYSMANHPAENSIVMLNVRIALPPPSTNYPPGVASSYIFNLKPGDKVNVSGPYGDFFISNNSKEVCFVGGGAGMAPMRSHIFDLFKTKKTKRKVTFWYGARSLRELFYAEEFDQIAKENRNFEWYPALSEPKPEDNWNGYTGFIHNILLNEYLDNHEDPTEIEYYLCGPPLMLDALKNMLYNIGVDSNNIFFDEF